MAKRTEERPFRPLDATLVAAVMGGNNAVAQEVREPEAVKAVELFKAAQPPPSVEIREAESLPEERAESSRQFLPGAAAQRPARRAPMPQTIPPSLEEGLNREKRVLLTRSEERTLERVVANIAAELGASLKVSHVLRSCIRLIIDAEGEIVERARATGRTVRPPNGDLAKIEAFEKVIANVLQAAIRSARPIR